ncbi:D-ribose pyranase [Loktanella sp. DSM 29012]|uniref:D-ribose pyranase n=1 Tax=Loktanella gaetbuli TaxID=2881335 RepID=A0ABS8BSE9_9RHOB|nr:MULTISPECIES: D-ribose pyranase [Loktanella]MCB5198669.1 D-ribose pyranase [Loktanella gaetbuli]SEQ62076.1 D-ribose pyranase [Loktanella sp. DSM 29012]
MKKTGILNAELSRAIAQMGHGDCLVVADAGLPLPAHLPVIDLAVVAGLPRFADVLAAILTELEVERCLMATEASPALQDLAPCPPACVPHTDFKRATQSARVLVRTGETTPYANIALYSGVTF